MHTLFDSIPTATRGAVKFPEFLYVKNGMSRELAEAVQYYHHERVRAVKSSHLLARLIQSMNVSMDRSYQNFLDVAEEKGMTLAKRLEITTPLQAGEVLEPGVFYGDGVDEILIFATDPIDIETAKVHWRDLQPIRVLRHPFDDISMPLALGEYPYDREGFAVIAIDIPMLMFQYRRWYETEKGLDEDADRSVYQFISMYPIPNMLYTHLDVAIFNRLHRMLRGEELSEFDRVHPFVMKDFSRKLDSFLEKQIDLLRRRRFTFEEILLGIPMLTAHNLFEVSRLPETIRTRQINWALVMARLPLIKFLLLLNDEANSRANRYYMNRIKMSLKEIRQDRTLKSSLPRKLYDELEETLRTDVAMYL